MNRQNRLIQVSLSLAIVFITNAGFALSSDSQQLAHFVSDAATYNYKNHIAIFTGNVIMTQGTTKLTAKKVTVYRNDKGQIKKMIAEGDLAHYQTLPDNDKRILLASAKTIQYYPQTGVSILINQASIQQGENEIHSERIVYNRNQQIMKTFPSKNFRTKIVLNPTNPPTSGDEANKQTT